MIPPKDKAFLDIKLVQECMDAHAKRIAIAFDIWKRENCINYDYENGCYSKLVFLDVDHTKVRCESISIDDTYDKFIESITK